MTREEILNALSIEVSKLLNLLNSVAVGKRFWVKQRIKHLRSAISNIKKGME